LQTRAAHQELDLVVTDLDATSEGQLGVDALDSVGALRFGVDLSDEIGEHRVSDGSLRG
jgi:hypothetical protein